MLYFFLLSIFSIVYAYEKDFTFTVSAGKTECFYHEVLPSQVIDIEYQVIDATHGELDVSFQLTDPVGQILVADYKKPENSHRHTSAMHGDYRFCFDNTFSTFSQKTVFFDLMIAAESEIDKDYDEDKELELGSSAESYLVRVGDIVASVAAIRERVAAARRLQELISATEARDRNLAEDMCHRVLWWSFLQIGLMVFIGLTQVVFVRSLFDDKQGSFRRYLPSFLTQ